MEIDDYILDKFLSERDIAQYYLTRKKNTDSLFVAKRMSKNFFNQRYYQYLNS